MNLESLSSKNQTTNSVDDFAMDDFDFKPITSGLGFHQPKTTEIKPAFVEKTAPPVMPTLKTAPPIRKEMNVYQNDLSLFYGTNTVSVESQPAAAPQEEVKSERVFKLASKTSRSIAYILDLLFINSIVALVLTVMARSIEMDLIEVWSMYPNEISPLVATLFCGFFMIYFSIFEKASVSTLGKSLLKIRVVNMNNEMQSFPRLLLRSFVSLANFFSLGLFSYFDLQNKVTNSKVIKAD